MFTRASPTTASIWFRELSWTVAKRVAATRLPKRSISA
jgi:hypothetical protein